MNEELRMLRDTFEGALGAAHPPTWEPPEGGEMAAETWATAIELGWDQIGLPEELGGFGGSVAALVLLAQACGRHRVPVPLVETALARWALALAQLDQPADGAVVTLAPGALGAGVTPADGRLDGRAVRVPWARHAGRLVLTGADGAVAAIDLQQPGVQVLPGVNLAGEARDDVVLTGVPAAVARGVEAARVAVLVPERAALLRAAQMLGALEQALAATREHTAARKQFGRPLDRFQLVGAHIADMAAHAALLEALLADATRAHDAGTPTPATASVKLVAGAAATIVARSAHQCHGAIGVTREYRLHQFTRRLWAWREEYGAERSWSRALGAMAISGSGADVWSLTEPQGVAV
jgi:alkylation response protein AidB-like acyl-CoA dehydrogenase